MQRKRKSSWSCLVGVFFGMGLACCIGCGGSAAPVPEEQPATQEQAASEEQPSPQPQPPETAQQPPDAGGSAEARKVMEAMVAAYKRAPTYIDGGTLRLYAKQGEKAIDDTAAFSVTLVRPDKIRIDAYQVIFVSDGKQLRARLLDLPDQVLAVDAPADLTIESILGCDRVVQGALIRGIAGPPLPMVLLLVDDVMDLLTDDVEELTLSSPEKIGKDLCHRLRVKRPGGAGVFWVDQQSHVLRRIEFPTEALKEDMASKWGKVDEISLVADFVDVRLGAKIDEKVFQFAPPPDARLVESFTPPKPGEQLTRLLGKRVPEFTFVNLEGEPATPKELQGKIVVIDLWATWCGPCKMSLPNLQQVYEKYKDNEKLAFLAVSVDEPTVENKVLEETFEELGVRVPIFRDLEQRAMAQLMVPGIPAMFVLGSDGVVQDYEIGASPNLVADLSATLEKLLAGQNVYEESLKRRTKSTEPGTPEGSAQTVLEEEIPRAEIAQASQPKSFKLTPLWKCTDVRSPGNILVVPREDGSPRVMAIDGGKSVVEVGASGEVAARHELPIEEEEVVTFLRTGTTSEGKRYFAASGNMQQRLHLFDENWKLLLSFPEDALENPHKGIMDVQFGDLDGDGTPELNVGHWEHVGVKSVSLEGKLLWSHRSIGYVLRMAVTAPDAQRRRKLLCVNERGSLVMLDANGKRQGEITVVNRPLQSIVAEDLDGDGQLEFCGLTVRQLGLIEPIGLNLEGQELWSYTLPKGIHQRPIEPIVVGNFSDGGPARWLLSGADGSIHVIAADGAAVDRFNYGTALAGLATATQDGKPALLVATGENLEAWRIEPPGENK